MPRKSPKIKLSVPTFLRSELRFPQTAVAWPFYLVHLLRRCASLPYVVSRTMKGRTPTLTLSRSTSLETG